MTPLPVSLLSLCFALTLILALPLSQRRVTLNLRMGTTGTSAEPQFSRENNNYSPVLLPEPPRVPAGLPAAAQLSNHTPGDCETQLWNLDMG